MLLQNSSAAQWVSPRTPPMKTPRADALTSHSNASVASTSLSTTPERTPHMVHSSTNITTPSARRSTSTCEHRVAGGTDYRAQPRGLQRHESRAHSPHQTKRRGTGTHGAGERGRTRRGAHQTL